MDAAESIVTPIAMLIDKIVADPVARDAAKLELLKQQDSPEIAAVRLRASAAEDAQSSDRWASRARPSFLYVMYALLLWAIPMGFVAAVDPAMATAIARGMTAYLNGIPEPLYALFGTGYLGYTVAREWGKAQASG